MYKAFDIPAEYVVHDVCHAQCKNDRVSSKGELMVVCPITGRDIEINMAKGGIWKCFRDCTMCPSKGKGGLLDFYMLYYPCGDRNEAARQIFALRDGSKEIYEQRKMTAMKPVELEATAPIEVRDKTYRKFLEKLPLSKAHREDLHSRGVSDEDIERMFFRSMPQVGLTAIAKSLENEGCILTGVPGFYRKNGEPAINCAGSGYFIPYYNEHGQIASLQIRYDVKITPEMTKKEVSEAKKKRYRLLSSSGKDGGAASANLPFFGIPGRKRKKSVYITEGALKAATAQSLSGGWFTAIPGVSCYTAFRTLMEFFKSNGITTIVDAFDSDRASKPDVANSIKQLHEIAASYGMEMKCWDWGTEQKGVDDFLLSQKLSRQSRKTASAV